MALEPRLRQRQTQGLAMTPRLQQSIRLLQMGSIELDAFVESQLEENPLLKRGEPDGEAGAPALPGEPDPRSDAGRESLRTAEDFVAAPRSAGGFDGDAPGPEERVAAAPTLRDRLERQLMLDIADSRDRLIGRAIIDALDPSGWFTVDLAGFAFALGALPEDVERVLLRLQQCEPAGLFARSLAECLALQLRDRGRCGPAMEALLDNLDLLAAGRFDALGKACGVDGDELARMVRELRSLDPKPAAALDGEAAVLPVVPDILVRAHPGGGWAVELNDEALPRVLVDREYYARVHGDAASDADREFIADRLSSANWLVKALHQRAETMLKVAAELVRRQQGFFAHGVGHLRPLTLRDIAEAVGIHESTVSRVTANKYLAGPLGLFELKYFFTAAIAGTEGGEVHSAEAVRHRLKALIDAEDPGRTLSDDKLVAAMRVEGIDIARRTVAKYRETMGIPSSAHRRRRKLAAAGGKGH
ncbi:MAG: RNA polymerase factor sigma-54 [Alphaproteobacteria bacterium]|nr:RNA polymerase factor sigma-54 [Alphaproteobacteria bacterium]